MNRIIYYFSGTGNTLAVARDVSKRIEAKLIPISSTQNADKIHINAKTIGIVFPSYLAAVIGIPLIVERFIRKISNIESLSIFAVCTCGGYESVNALPSLRKLEQAIRSCGGKLSSAYSVRLPMNNLDYDHIPIPIDKDSSRIIAKSKTKIDRICESILKKRGTRYKLPKALFFLIMKPLFCLMKRPVMTNLKEKAVLPTTSNLKYYELIPLTDKSIVVDEKCVGCGTCAQVCPVNNIKITNKKPLFQHRCEMCFACDEWCPSDAIHHWSRSEGTKYHHPETSISDMLISKNEHSES